MKLEKDFDVAAVVYLSFLGDKKPDVADWDPKYKEIIGKKLVRVAAFTKDEKPNLRTGWVDPCVTEATNVDAKVILGQYGKLLQYLGADVMNNEVMGTYWQLMQQDDNLAAAGAVREMLERVPEYLARQTQERYSRPKCSPFDRTSVWAPRAPQATPPSSMDSNSMGPPFPPIWNSGARRRL